MPLTDTLFLSCIPSLEETASPPLTARGKEHRRVFCFSDLHREQKRSKTERLDLALKEWFLTEGSGNAEDRVQGICEVC